ncbi:hypothetical protein [Marinicellulosiphila megalodicopiae]|uniref:hypothetical protein n=1 Tax=Marinicellulosiphila megalodicopiae TaxID=2724896 RepID=UPI003BB1AD0A
MTQIFSSQIGKVISADIAVGEVELAIEFYAKVLGAGANALWQNDLMNNVGQPIIGIGLKTATYKNLPNQWMPHFQVKNVSASLNEAIKSGGKDLMHSQNDDGSSNWAVILDPNSSTFGLIPQINNENLEPYLKSQQGSNTKVGCIHSVEMYSQDESKNASVLKAKELSRFYQNVLGLSEHINSAENSIQLYDNKNSEPANKMISFKNFLDEDEGISSAWIIKLLVGDIQESLLALKSTDAQLVKSYIDSDGNQNAIIKDPFGVIFGLVQTN